MLLTQTIPRHDAIAKDTIAAVVGSQSCCLSGSGLHVKRDKRERDGGATVAHSRSLSRCLSLSSSLFLQEICRDSVGDERRKRERERAVSVFSPLLLNAFKRKERTKGVKSAGNFPPAFASTAATSASASQQQLDTRGITRDLVARRALVTGDHAVSCLSCVQQLLPFSLSCSEQSSVSALDRQAMCREELPFRQISLQSYATEASLAVSLGVTLWSVFENRQKRGQHRGCVCIRGEREADKRSEDRATGKSRRGSRTMCSWRDSVIWQQNRG